MQEIILYPILAGVEKDRKVGIAPALDLMVHGVTPGSPADKAGLKAEDRILNLDGKPLYSFETYREYMERHAKNGVTLDIKRAETVLAIKLPPDDSKNGHGLTFTTGFTIIHPTPWSQIAEQVQQSFRTIGSLINRQSDVGLNKVSGPVGIFRIFYSAAEIGILAVITITILVNVSLAIFNLLPIPVLDGGHMLFATIAKLRGKALPINFIAMTQTVFLVLLLSMIVYVSYFDVRRAIRDNQPAAAAPAAATTPAAQAPATPAPAPAK